MELTLTPKPVESVEPDSVVFYAPPKAGKSTLLAALPRHYIYSLQPNGYRNIEAAQDYYPDYGSLDKGIDAMAAIPLSQRPQFIGLDYFTRLEELSGIKAYDNYVRRFPAAAKENKSITDLIASLPKGTAWALWRREFIAYIERFARLERTLVFVGHTKPKAIDDTVQESDTGDMDLQGKNQLLLASLFQVTARLLRNKGVLIASTRVGGTKSITAGTTCPYLVDRDIVLARTILGPNGRQAGVQTFWEEIFPSLKPGSEPAK